MCPSLLLILVVILGIHFGITQGGLLGAFIGLGVDVLSSASIGPYLFTYLICGALAGTAAKKVYRQHWLTALLITLGGTLMEGLVIGIWAGHGEFIWLTKSILLPGLLYNGLVSVPVSLLIYQFLKPSLTPQVIFEI